MELQKSKSKKSNDVALSFTKHLFSKNHYEKKNLVFSPFILNAALSVMAAGSEGRPLHELLSFLRFDSVDDLTTFFSHLLSAAAAPYNLSFSNGLWADKSLQLSHSFKQLVATHYKATLNSVDFKTQGDQVHHEVNSWIEKETNGLITQVLPPGTVTKLTKLIFANAIYFKGAWKHDFDRRPYHHKFDLLNGTRVRVPFMTSEKDQFIRAFDGFKVLRLSYKQGGDKKRRFSMYIFLPDAIHGLSTLIEKLSSESDFLKDKLPRRKVQVNSFMIPKFNISFSFEASKVLKELGVVSPFSQWDNALDKLYVESISHKALIKVNENGTEATAATIVEKIFLGCSPPRPVGIDFVADHPFLFLIREDFTGTILFVGQVVNPLDGAATPVKVSNLYS
ncbi:serpin-ZX-like [Lotus japonicus]|uniref:serpin-ZX-like n=1 Tax=Lotus japonicus TaxID=34305 RepID=UPI00258CB8C7|nr:serpin-ZX-like [Lotus japonicus]